MSRYFLDKDDDSHLYLVPLDVVREWDEWLEAQEDCLPLPAGVQMLGIHMSRVTFTDPMVGCEVLG
jgi:hypothetical protein